MASRADAPRLQRHPNVFESDQSPARTGHKIGGIQAISVGNVAGNDASQEVTAASATR